ncbi:MAG TPA: CBS domain-containing protein [Azoarcus sp.]|nr:CBS domain-containing protein [Azoarcus sp.]
MTREVITVSPQTPVQEIVNLMLRNRISAAPVVDDAGKVVGMVSEGDLMYRAENQTNRRDSWWLTALFSARNDAADYVKSHGQRARNVMTRDVISVEEDTPLYKIAQTLEKHRIKRVPVLREGKLVGIVSRSNLLHGLSAMRADNSGAEGDLAIRDHIVTEMKDKLGIPGSMTNVVVVDGVVTLWGLVENENERQAAGVAAENAPGVKNVNNHLGIAPAVIGPY